MLNYGGLSSVKLSLKQKIIQQKLLATNTALNHSRVMKNASQLKIGELAKKTGVTVGTLRYYSDLGLLQPVERGSNGYRYYSFDASQQVEFIKKAQILGFTLAEIKQILDVRDRGEKPCSLVQSLLDQKIEQLQIQIRQMTLFKLELEQYRTAWTNNPNPESKREEICPLISTVSLPSASPK